MPPGYLPTRPARDGLVAALVAAASWRLVEAGLAGAQGDPGPATAYGFTVLLPALIVGRLLTMGPTRTAEGAMMRLGTAAQFVLVIALPGFALSLVLGLPVVFLIVELFETRLPATLRDRVRGRLVAC